MYLKYPDLTVRQNIGLQKHLPPEKDTIPVSKHQENKKAVVKIKSA